MARQSRGRPAGAVCAKSAVGHAPTVMLSRLALALLGAGCLLPASSPVQSMEELAGQEALAGAGPEATAARVARWRARVGAQAEEDFAFAFYSFDNALQVAGPEVAASWQEVRGRLRDASGLALVHAAAEAGAQVSSPSRPPLPRRYKPVPPGGRIKQQAAVPKAKDGITEAMIRELTDLLVDAHCRRPKGGLTSERGLCPSSGGDPGESHGAGDFPQCDSYIEGALSFPGPSRASSRFGGGRAGRC